VKKICLLILIFFLICIAGASFAPAHTAFAANNPADSESLQETIEGIINWKKSDIGATDTLFTPDFLELAGSTPGDWYPCGMVRYGYE